MRPLSGLFLVGVRFWVSMKPLACWTENDVWCALALCSLLAWALREDDAGTDAAWDMV